MLPFGIVTCTFLPTTFLEIAVSIYISLYMKTFLKTGVYIYIDTSVLLENIRLVKFIKTTSGTPVVYFYNLTLGFIDDVMSVISLYYFINVVLSI